MGHLTLLAEDVITALERFPPELRLIMVDHAPVPEWDQYVTGRYNETKKRDTRLLGGGKPVIAPGVNKNVANWKVDEGEDPDSASGSESKKRSNGDSKGEFRRAGGGHPARASTADFGPASMEDDDDDDDDHHAPPRVRIVPSVYISFMY